MATIGTKLVRLRTQKGLSQDEIAARLQVSQPAYHKWETDTTKPTNENILKICNLFEIDIVELLDDDTSSFAHNTITGSTIFSPTNSVISNINLNSPELIESIIANQKELSKLVDLQSKLVNELLKK